MLKRFLYTHDWILTVIMLLILSIGLMTIYSTGIDNATDTTFTKQIIFAISGFFIYIAASLIDYSYLRYKPIVFLLYGLDIFLLALDFIAGSTIRGATRWLTVGIVNLQPSEITKLILIIALSSFLAGLTGEDYKTFAKSLLLFLPLAILVFIEPSLSASIVLLVIWAVIYYASGNRQVQKALTAICFLLAVNLGSALFMPKVLFPIFHGFSIGIILLTCFIYLICWTSKQLPLRVLGIYILIGFMLGISGKYVVWDHILKPYQRERITAFITQNDPHSTNPVTFQVQQSKIAVGSGELVGKGFAQGTQSKLNFLPDHDTDFIFASFSEEFGLIGDILLIGLFGALFFRIFSIAEKIEDRFGFLLVVGILAVFAFQTFANIAINMGLLPATGIPMPFVSYGGSSLIITFILLGLVQSIQTSAINRKWTSIDI